MTGFGAVRLTGPRRGIVVEAPQHRADDVVEVDPRDVLPAAGDRPANSQPEGREHLLERAPCADSTTPVRVVATRAPAAVA